MKVFIAKLFLIAVMGTIIYIYNESCMPDKYFSLYKNDKESHFLVADKIFDLKKRKNESQKKILNNISIIDAELNTLRNSNDSQIVKTSKGISLISGGVEYSKISDSVAYLISEEMGIEITDRVERKDYSKQDLKNDLESLKNKYDKGYLSIEKDLVNLKESKRELTIEDFRYFSWITATTTGYGDISPASTEARLLVKRQIILSYFIFSLIAGLVLSLFNKENKQDS